MGSESTMEGDPFVILATYIAFYAAIAVYLAASVAAASYLWTASQRALVSAQGCSLGAALLLFGAFILRWVTWNRLPMTSLTDTLTILILIASAIMLVLVRGEQMHAMLSFYLPPLAPLCLVAGAAAVRDFPVPPRDLPEVLLAVHVGLAFLAYALFFGASLTSVAYLVQTQRLKNRRIDGLFQKLPSLERLDRVLFGLISFGYPFFVVTVVLGALWAWRDSELLSATWWLSPKIFLSVVMAAFYALAFHTRRLGRLRGPKLAYFVVCGFALLLTTYLALALFDLNTYNFWGAST